MLHVGQKFMSFEEIESAVEEYENANNMKFMKLHSNMLNAGDMPCNVNLKYKSLVYNCIRGGPFKKRGRGLRNTKSIKQNCSASLLFRISEDKMYLEVKNIVAEHNHEVSERWVYFKDDIPRSVRRKLKLKGMFIRNTMYQMDGNVNLRAALVEPKALEALQQKLQNNKKATPEQETNLPNESLCLGEVSQIESTTRIPPSPKCSKEKTDSALMDTQKSILNTLNHLNQNIQTLATNMINMTAAINSLAESVNGITRVLQPDVPVVKHGH